MRHKIFFSLHIERLLNKSKTKSEITAIGRYIIVSCNPPKEMKYYL